jgi:hypothetical protein
VLDILAQIRSGVGGVACIVLLSHRRLRMTQPGTTSTVTTALSVCLMANGQLVDIPTQTCSRVWVCGAVYMHMLRKNPSHS